MIRLRISLDRRPSRPAVESPCRFCWFGYRGRGAVISIDFQAVEREVHLAERPACNGIFHQIRWNSKLFVPQTEFIMVTYCLTFLAGGLIGYLLFYFFPWKPVTKSSETDGIPTQSAPKIPPYLTDNDWEQELNLKLWSTKGARFQADKRCSHLSRLSQFSTSLLTAYVIIIGLMPYFLKSRLAGEAGDFVNYISTAISIILLAYSLIESFQEYGLQAHLFHQCGLSISKLYNRLRQAKCLPDTERLAELRKISEEYDDILGRFENHENLDFEVFQTMKPDWFRLSPMRCRFILFKYFCKVRFRHYAIMIFPPLVILWIISHAYIHPLTASP